MQQQGSSSASDNNNTPTAPAQVPQMPPVQQQQKINFTSEIVFDMCPHDDTVDWNHVKKYITTMVQQLGPFIRLLGVAGTTTSKNNNSSVPPLPSAPQPSPFTIVPIAYGITKLRCRVHIVDDKITWDDIEEAIMANAEMSELIRCVEIHSYVKL